jgi:hypothetical protein
MSAVENQQDPDKASPDNNVRRIEEANNDSDTQRKRCNMAASRQGAKKEVKKPKSKKK